MPHPKGGFKTSFGEGEAPAEPRFSSVSARREPRPPGFETASKLFSIRERFSDWDRPNARRADGVHEVKQRGSPGIGRRHCRLDFSHRRLVQDATFGRLTSLQLILRLLESGIWPLLRVRLCVLVVPLLQ